MVVWQDVVGLGVGVTSYLFPLEVTIRKFATHRPS